MPIKALDNESYDSYINRILSLRPNKKVSRAQQRHHILPKSRGGSNDEDNLIWLYASEHATAHYLYSKEHPDDAGMAYAADILAHKDGQLLSDEEINEIAERNSICQSKRVSGEGNPMWGKKQSEESKRKNAESQKGKSAGKKNPMYGIHLCGALHPRYGKPVSQAQREKQSKAMKGKLAGGKNGNAKKIKCINTGEIFDTIIKATRWCGMKSPSQLRKSAKDTSGKTYAGKHPQTKEKLYWEFIDS